MTVTGAGNSNFDENQGLTADESKFLLRNSMNRRVISIEKKIERGDKRLDEAMEKLSTIAEFKVADWMSVKEFN